MANGTIADIVEQIRHAIFGKDVRENIALGIEKCYTDFGASVLHTTDIANNLTQISAGKVLDAKQGRVLNDRLKNVIASSGGTSFDYYQNFVNGGLLNGELTNSKNRVSTQSTLTIDRELYITVKNGFRCAIHYFTNGVFSRDTGLSTGSLYIPSGSTFKVSIARVSEISGEIADIDEFVSKVTFLSEDAYQIQKNTSRITEMKSFMDGNQFTFTPKEFEQGGYITTVGSEITTYSNNTRARTPVYECNQNDSYRIVIPNGIKFQMIDLDKQNIVLKSSGFVTGTYSSLFMGTKFAIILGRTDDTNISLADLYETLHLTIIPNASVQANIDAFTKLYGKNYLHSENYKSTIERGIAVAKQKDGSLLLTGTATSNYDYYLLGSVSSGTNKTSLQKGCPYVISTGSVKNTGVSIRLICTNGSDETFAIGEDSVFTMGDDIKLIIRIANGTTLNGLKLYPMIRSAGTNGTYNKSFNREMIDATVDYLNTNRIPENKNVFIENAAALYNGIKLDSTVIELARLHQEGYNEHDGTIVQYDNYLYCVYSRFSGSGGDSAINPNARVELSIVEKNTGNLVKTITVATNGDSHGTLIENGGAGSPNAYLVGSFIHILYTAYVNSTYQQMHCVYDISNDSLSSYSVITVNGQPLNNAWIREHYGLSSSELGNTAYSSAQANSTIATDGTDYYIGWVCGSVDGHAIIFKTRDFATWEIYWEYEELLNPIYEFALGIKGNYLYFAIRPHSYYTGICGQISLSGGYLIRKCFYDNCGSRPAFFMLNGELYLFTNPFSRDNYAFYKIHDWDLTMSTIIAEGAASYNYASFSVDESSGWIYMMRSDNYLQVTKFKIEPVTKGTVQYKIAQLFNLAQ